MKCDKMPSNCRKFMPNIFNKSKCQNCFAVKEHHTAEALESSKASRKVVICAYLFVSPGYDFNNPMERTRRWQRRFFVLYDDGELIYAVDENPGTVPQGSVDMNKCGDVRDAEALTGHPYSMAVVTADHVHYIKGSSKFEIARWFDILAQYPRSKKSTKLWKNPVIQPAPDKHTAQAAMEVKESHKSSDELSSRDSAASVAQKSQAKPVGDKPISDIPRSTSEQSLTAVANEALISNASTYRGVRDLKHRTADKTTTDDTGMRKSSSMCELSRMNEDAPDGLPDGLPDRLPDDTPRERRLTPSFVERFNNYVTRAAARPSSALQSRHMTTQTEQNEFRRRSRSLQAISSRFSVHASDLTEALAIDRNAHSVLSSLNRNETDELKIASRSSSQELRSDMTGQNPSAYMKKGWLIRQRSEDKEWIKHWFVLTDDSVRYYQDAKAEDNNVVDGQIDLSTCTLVEQFDSGRNYGFRVKNNDGVFVMSAMTSGIRNNWIRAIKQSVSRHASRQTTAPATPSDQGVATEATQESRRLETARPVRRHHSDLNLRNMKDLFVIGDINIRDSSASDALATPAVKTRSLDAPMSRHSRHSLSSDDSRLPTRLTKAPDLPQRLVPSLDLKLAQLRYAHPNGKQPPSVPLSTISFHRFVEGSEAVSPDQSAPAASADTEPVHHRPPSVKVKDKSRSKSPRRLHSPPPVSVSSPPGPSDSDAIYTLMGAQTEAGVGEDQVDDTQIGGLKRELEKSRRTTEELRATNLTLKDQILALNKLQSPDCGVLSPDYIFPDSTTTPAQIRKQLIQSQETTYKQKVTIDNLNIKLEQSKKRLTKNEDELSKAVTDLKQEKEKFLRLSDDWNARIKSLEDQLDETVHLLDGKKEELATAVGKCKRLDNDVRNKQDKLREKDRELVKLKAIERDNKELKEKLEKKDATLSTASKKAKEQEKKAKKRTDDYEKQLDAIDRQYTVERADLSQHIDNLKRQFNEVQRQNVIAGNANSNMSDIIREKDEIISQLEEKVIETDDRIAQFMDEQKDVTLIKEKLRRSSKDRVKPGGNTPEIAGTVESLNIRTAELEKILKGKDDDVQGLKAKINGVKRCTVELSSVLNYIGKSNQLDIEKTKPYLEYLMNLLEDYSDKVADSRIDAAFLKHDVSVDASSETKRILDEYLGLKKKYDTIVADLEQSAAALMKVKLTYHCGSLEKLRGRIDQLHGSASILEEVGERKGQCGDLTNEILSFEQSVDKLEEFVKRGKPGKAVPLTHQGEQKLVKSESKLGDCQTKLSNIIDQVVAYQSPVKQCAVVESQDDGSITATQTIAQKHLLMHSLLRSKESHQRHAEGGLSEEQKLSIEAEKLSCEAAILNELAFVIELEGSDSVVVDLVGKVNDILTEMFCLEQMISNEPTENLFSKYAELLAEQVIKKGQVFAYLKSMDEEKRLSHCLDECIVAQEVLTRSEVQYNRSHSESNTKGHESSRHLIANALLQGELTVALKQMRHKLNIQQDDIDGDKVIKNILRDVMEHLNSRAKLLTELADKDKMECISNLSCSIIMKLQKSGKDSTKLDTTLHDIEVELKRIGEKRLGVAKRETEWYDTCIANMTEEFEFAISHVKSTCANYSADISSFQGSPSDLLDSKTYVQHLGEVLSWHAVCTGTVMYLNSVCDHISTQTLQRTSATKPERDNTSETVSEILRKESLFKKNTSDRLERDSRAGGASDQSDCARRTLADYPEMLVRESSFQAQLIFMFVKLELKKKQDVHQVHKTLRAVEHDSLLYHGSLSPYLDLESLLTKHEKEIHKDNDSLNASLNSLAAAINEIKLTGDADSTPSQVSRLISVIREKVEKTQAISGDMRDAKSKLGVVLEDYEREKETLIADYEDHIAQLEEEIEVMNEQHETEFDQLKQDMFTAVSAIKASEEQTESDRCDEVMGLKHQLSSQRAKVKMELHSMRCSIPHAQRDTKLAVALLGKIQNVEAILTGLKSSSQESLLDLVQPNYNSASSSEGESESESSDTADIVSDSERVTRAASTKHDNIDMQLHKRILLRMHERHKTEIDGLKKDKEKALEGEMKSTRAALEAMRKTYEEELQEERSKYSQVIDTMYSQADIGDLSRKHSLEAEHLSEEIAKVKKKNTAMAEELRNLRESHDKVMSRGKDELQKTQLKYDQMNVNLNKELEKLRGLLTASKSSDAKGEKRDSYCSSQLVLKLKDTEIKHLRDQIRNNRERLAASEQKQNSLVEEFGNLREKHSTLSEEHERELSALKQRLDQAFLALRAESGPMSRRNIKRVTSFNSSNSRSPSPPRPQSVRKDSMGHVSREGARRRHIHPRDLRRSKSSPSVPSLNKAVSASQIRPTDDLTTTAPATATADPATFDPVKRALFET